MLEFPAPTVARLMVLLALSLAARLACAESDADQPALQPPPAASESTDAAPNPAGGGGSSVIERVETPAPRAKRLVYACRDGATPMFSDRPCGDRANARQLDVEPPNAAGAAPTTRAAVPAATTRPIASPAPRRAAPAPPDRCARLAEQLADIDARMRQGYSAREAARLWQRWRDAKAKLRSARC